MTSTELAELPSENALAAVDLGTLSGASLVLNEVAMQRIHSLATVMAAGVATVPKHLQKNVGDCMAVCMQAAQWGLNPYAVAQKTHLVNGTLGYEAQLINAVITTMAPTKGRLQYEWFGDWKGVKGKDNKSPDHGVKVWATLKGEDEPRELVVTMAEAGVRNSPLWEQAPKIQLAYLAVKRWARLFTPDVILGVYTPDEFDAAPTTRRMGAADVVHPEPPAELVAAADAAAAKGVEAYQTFWKDAGAANRKLLTVGHEERKATASAVDQHRIVENAPRTAAAPAATDKPAFTFADVASKLKAAGDVDALDIAASLIAEVADGQHRAELNATYEAMRKEKQQ